MCVNEISPLEHDAVNGTLFEQRGAPETGWPSTHYHYRRHFQLRLHRVSCTRHRCVCVCVDGWLLCVQMQSDVQYRG